MRLVRIDPSGRLVDLRVALFTTVPSGERPVEPDWALVFRAADLSFEAFNVTDVAFTPSMSVDTLRAWTGVHASDPNTKIRVEAASLLGRVVFFRVTGPWTAPVPPTPPPPTLIGRAIVASTIIVGCLLVVCVTILACRNLVLARSDGKAAARTSLFLLVTTVAMWVFSMTQVGNLGEVVSSGVLVTGVAWALYVAFEPYVRRFWPESLMGWTRLLSGRWRDARVGRDLLFGLAGGVAAALWMRVLRLIIASVVPTPQPTVSPLWPSLNILFFTSELLNITVNAVMSAMLAVFALVVARIVLKRASFCRHWWRRPDPHHRYEE